MLLLCDRWTHVGLIIYIVFAPNQVFPWSKKFCLYMSCCPVLAEASATGRSLVQRSPTGCLIVCD
jgi:hypothetical protein